MDSFPCPNKLQGLLVWRISTSFSPLGCYRYKCRWMLETFDTKPWVVGRQWRGSNMCQQRFYNSLRLRPLKIAAVTTEPHWSLEMSLWRSCHPLAWDLAGNLLLHSTCCCGWWRWRDGDRCWATSGCLHHALHSKTESNARGKGCWDAKHSLTFSRCCIPEMKDAHELDSTEWMTTKKDEAQEP